MSGRAFRRVVASAMTGAMAVTGVALVAPAAQADVVPGNESDIGVYTSGTTDSMDIGDPVYTNLGPVAAALEPGVPWTAGSMHGSIFDKDLAAGGTDYYLDRVLGVSGTSGNNVLQTRGRSLYMRGNSNWGVMGFAGSAFAGGPNNLGNLYTVTVPGRRSPRSGPSASTRRATRRRATPSGRRASSRTSRSSSRTTTWRCPPSRSATRARAT